jgi:4-amino-4-deoxy-L-arabinose transferase-like glycosyltransferase
MFRGRELLFIAICTALLAFLGVSGRPLTRSSEGRVARVAQEMIESGDWVVPHLNGEIRREKPPLSSWIVALTAQASGAERVSALHAFIAPGVSMILLVLLVALWTRAATAPASAPIDEPGAPPNSGESSFPMLAAFFLAAAPGFLLQGRSAEIDMMLALFVALSLWGYWKFRVDGWRPGLAVMYVALALSVLTKGHVAAVIVVPTLIIWSIYEATRQALPARPVRSAVWHILGIVLLCAIVLPWAIPFLEQSGITWEHFNREGGTARFSTEVTGHIETISIGGTEYNNIFWYLYQVPGWFLPWILLLPLGVMLTWNLPPDERSPLRRLCWIWLGWSMLLFSALAAKQRHYGVPFFPPVAILTADAAARWLEHPLPGRRKAARVFIAVLSVLLASLCIAVPLLAPKKFEHAEHFAVPIWSLGGAGAAVFLMSAYMSIKRGRCYSSWWAGAVCAVSLYAVTVDFEEAKTDNPEPFCKLVRLSVPATEPLYDYNVTFANNVWRAHVLFYLERKVTRSEKPLADLIEQSDAPIFALATTKVLSTVPTHYYEVLLEAKGFLGKRYDVFLIRSRPN